MKKSKVSVLEALTRQNTGSSLCDSGSTYGYNYDRALPKQDITLSKYVRQDKSIEVSAYISLGKFLNACFEYDKLADKKFKQFCKRKDNEKLSWWECLELYAEKLGKKLVIEYTYNNENDLDQDYQYFVMSSELDWYYDNDALFFIQAHNGCDARGGFSEPMACRNKSDTYFLDVVVGWNFISGKRGKVKLDQDDLQALGEHYQVGYTSNPSYDLFNNCTVISVNIKKCEVKIKLNSGEVVVAVPYCSALSYL